MSKTPIPDGHTNEHTNEHTNVFLKTGFRNILKRLKKEEIQSYFKLNFLRNFFNASIDWKILRLQIYIYKEVYGMLFL